MYPWWSQYNLSFVFEAPKAEIIDLITGGSYRFYDFNNGLIEQQLYWLYV